MLPPLLRTSGGEGWGEEASSSFRVHAAAPVISHIFIRPVLIYRLPLTLICKRDGTHFSLSLRERAGVRGNEAPDTKDIPEFSYAQTHQGNSRSVSTLQRVPRRWPSQSLSTAPQTLACNKRPSQREASWTAVALYSLSPKNPKRADESGDLRTSCAGDKALLLPQGEGRDEGERDLRKHRISRTARNAVGNSRSIRGPAQRCR
jgi:hypothetical protein